MFGGEERKQRVIPDLLMEGVGFALAVDVTGVYGESTSYVSEWFDRDDWAERKGTSDGNISVSGSSGRRRRQDGKLLNVFSQREAKKVKTYEAECERRGWKFEPFVFESHGHLTASAERVVKMLAKQGEETTGTLRVDNLNYIKRRVAIAIQRGNAALNVRARNASWGTYGAAVGMGYVVPRRGDC